MCPVFVARTTDPVRADPDEVDDVAWEPWAVFRAGVLDGTRPVSSWCREQVRELPADPLGAAEAAYDGLPHAAGADGPLGRQPAVGTTATAQAPCSMTVAARVPIRDRAG